MPREKRRPSCKAYVRRFVVGELAAAMKEIDARYADEHGHELSRPKAWPDESKLHHLSDGEREQRCRAPRELAEFETVLDTDINVKLRKTGSEDMLLEELIGARLCAPAPSHPGLEALWS